MSLENQIQAFCRRVLQSFNIRLNHGPNLGLALQHTNPTIVIESNQPEYTVATLPLLIPRTIYDVIELDTISTVDHIANGHMYVEGFGDLEIKTNSTYHAYVELTINSNTIKAPLTIPSTEDDSRQLPLDLRIPTIEKTRSYLSNYLLTQENLSQIFGTPASGYEMVMRETVFDDKWLENLNSLITIPPSRPDSWHINEVPM